MAAALAISRVTTVFRFYKCQRQDYTSVLTKNQRKEFTVYFHYIKHIIYFSYAIYNNASESLTNS